MDNERLRNLKRPVWIEQHNISAFLHLITAAAALGISAVMFTNGNQMPDFPELGNWLNKLFIRSDVGLLATGIAHGGFAIYRKSQAELLKRLKS